MRKTSRHSACHRSFTRAALFFGLIVWTVVQNNADDWMFKLSDKHADDPFGTTYWRRRDGR